MRKQIYKELIKHKRLFGKKYELSLDVLNKIILDLKKELITGSVILVEGKRDVESLAQLGLQQTIIKYSEMGERRCLEYIERNKVQKIIILTDFDEEGENILVRLEDKLENTGVKIDKQYRKKFFETIRFCSNTIEGAIVLSDDIKRRQLFQNSLKQK